MLVDRRITTAHDRYARTRTFGALDGLRTIAVVSVIWHHTATSVGIDATPLLRGFLGVDLFFAISGFLITTLLLREQDRNGRIDMKAFYARRSLRIFPLYYAALALHGLVLLQHGFSSPELDLFIENLPAFVTYTTNWFVVSGTFMIAWSLAAEEQFYLVWPFVMSRISLQTATISVGIVTTVLSLLHLFVWDSRSADLGVRILQQVPAAISAGVFVALVLHQRHLFDRVARMLGGVWAAPAALVGWLALALVPGVAVEFTQPMAAVVIAAAVLREDHAAMPLLQLGLMRRIGTLSYGMYLLHFLVLDEVRRFGAHAGVTNTFLVFVATVVATMAVAQLSYSYFESVFLRRKGAWAR